ncbi:MAG: glucose-6-phosphate dehydrogenase [Lautropia sp.]
MPRTLDDSPAPVPVDPFTFVLHGATGDLARRKILPALGHLASAGYFPAGSRVVLAQRQAMSAAQALQEADVFLADAGDEAARAALAALAPLTQTAALTLGDERAKAALAAATAGGAQPVVHYAALPASRFVDLMACIDGPRDPALLRVVLEKPFGFSGAEARRIEAAVAAKVDECQIYRIDHYLGKQAVQNLLALRLGNLIFEPLFNRQHVAHVQITVAEHLGVEDRAGFYEQSGALRDMVQSHMLQLLATIAMEPPIDLEADSLRDEKLKVLRSLSIPNTGGHSPEAVFGQYCAGHVEGRAVPDYLDEPGVAVDSRTETFVALRTEVRTWRWAGVPFLLRTGKRMPQRFAEIVVQFRDVPHPLFAAVGGPWSGDRLVVRMQPEDRVQLHLLAKSPGERQRLRPVMLNLDFFDAWRIPVRDAYERLITDILRGRLGLFLRRDEVQTQWAFVDRLRAGFDAEHERPLPYAAGSYGPPQSAALAASAGAMWSESIVAPRG